MAVSRLVVLVEERSMEAALQELLPRLLGNVAFEIHPFQGKEDLLRCLPSRLQGYASWLPEDWRIVILVDRDRDDCRQLKNRLEEAVRAARLRSKTTTKGAAYQVASRVAIEELEAWYFGDWSAVQAAYPRVPPTIPNDARYRDPDAVRGGTCEAFERILKRAGYFRTGLRKIEAARTIAKHWEPSRNRSRSFHVFVDAVRALAAGQDARR